ncbi:MAG TPA: MBL fold metallo-hydrolase [bacterium]|nr:MBL fold metallo-hydrolase [bacterium]
MIKKELFNNGTRRWIYIGRDPDLPEAVIDTNEYVVIDDGKALLLDPGGIEIFPAVTAMLTREVSLDSIEAIFASHQDPDIVSSLSLWLDLCPQIQVYSCWIWTTFLAHFGGYGALRAVPDHGGPLPLGRSKDLTLIPAHYCHSAGNYSLYDPQARILFSGDIGAALLPRGQNALFVEDFDAHVPAMEGFHRRWMPSNEAKNRWVQRVRQLDVDMLCPQHGAIFRGEMVGRFLDWFEAFNVGVTTEMVGTVGESADLTSRAGAD